MAQRGCESYTRGGCHEGLTSFSSVFNDFAIVVIFLYSVLMISSVLLKDRARDPFCYPSRATERWYSCIPKGVLFFPSPFACWDSVDVVNALTRLLGIHQDAGKQYRSHDISAVCVEPRVSSRGEAARAPRPPSAGPWWQCRAEATTGPSAVLAGASEGVVARRPTCTGWDSGSRSPRLSAFK